MAMQEKWAVKLAGSFVQNTYWSCRESRCAQGNSTVWVTSGGEDHWRHLTPMPQ